MFNASAPSPTGEPTAGTGFPDVPGSASPAHAAAWLFGIRFDLLTAAELRTWLRTVLTGPRELHRIAFTNPEFVLEARRNEPLRQYLSSCTLNLVDGVGLVLAFRIVAGLRPPGRLTGTDFVTMVGEEAAATGARLFLFGGRPGVAAKAAAVLEAQHPGLVVGGVLDGFAGVDGALDRIRTAAPDVLMVCLGNPRQERWIAEHLDQLDVRLVFGNGGALDFWSGDVPRAPRRVQQAGLEWLFRLLTNFSVARLRRQLRLVGFVWLVARTRLARGGRGGQPADRHPASGAQPGAASVPGRPSARTRIVRLGTHIVRVGFALGRLGPLRPRVVLATQNADGIGGNLQSIRDELARRTPPVPVTVIAYRNRRGARGRIEGAWQAIRAGYDLATARLFVVDDWFFPMYVVKPRPGTVRIQVWHAAGAFKRFGYSVLDRSFGVDERMTRLVPIHTNYDLCLVSSASATPHYMDAFRLPRERFTSTLGLPRTDLFFDPQRRDRAAGAIRRRYALPSGGRVVLYAPTFRGDTVRDARYDDALDLAAMRDALAPDWTLLLRLHPYVRRRARIAQDLAGFVIDVSDWPDMNELMLVADLLVTDYSSAIFEFALLDRPLAFFAPDLDDYEGERGFYFDYRSGVPGPVFETTGDLAAFVAAGRFDLEPVRAFASRWFEVADGHASERFVDRVVLPALRGEPIRIEDAPVSPGSA